MLGMCQYGGPSISCCPVGFPSIQGEQVPSKTPITRHGVGEHGDRGGFCPWRLPLFWTCKYLSNTGSVCNGVEALAAFGGFAPGRSLGPFRWKSVGEEARDGHFRAFVFAPNKGYLECLDLSK